MQARDVMTTNVVKVGPETDIRTMARLLLEHHISAVPVVDPSGTVVGIVSEGDLMRRSEIDTERHRSWWLWLVASPGERAEDYVKSHGRQVSDVMSRSVVTVAEDTSLLDVAQTLEAHGIKRVPVVEDGKLVGVVSRADLLRGLVASGATRPVLADDGQTRVAVKNAITEAGVRTELLSVVVSDGVAHLWGPVETEAEKRAALVAAETASGVRHVEDNLRVAPQVFQLLYL